MALGFCESPSREIGFIPVCRAGPAPPDSDWPSFLAKKGFMFLLRPSKTPGSLHHLLDSSLKLLYFDAGRLASHPRFDCTRCLDPLRNVFVSLKPGW